MSLYNISLIYFAEGEKTKSLECLLRSLKIMEDLKNKAENLTEHINQYLDTAFKILVLQAAKKTVNVASSSLITACISVLSLFVLLFSGLGLSWWIGSLIHSMVAGLFIVAGIYVFLIAMVIILKRKFIFPMVRNYLTKNLYE